MLKNKQQVVVLFTVFSLLFAPYSYSGPLNFIKNFFKAKENLPKELTKEEKIILMVQHVMLMQELKGFQKTFDTQSSVSKAIKEFESRGLKVDIDQLKDIVSDIIHPSTSKNKMLKMKSGRLMVVLFGGLALFLMNTMQH